MNANPLIDQVAAQVRDRSADRPDAVDEMARMFAVALRRHMADVAPAVTDEQLGAVLLVVASMLTDPNTPAESRMGTSNLLAVVGEGMYHGRIAT